jgi:hypothetical protein
VTNANRAFREVRDARSALERLQSLPYLNSARDPHGKASGVLLLTIEVARTKVSLFTDRAPERPLSSWTWTVRSRGSGEQHDLRHHFSLLPDGGLITLVNGEGVERLDVDSRTLWSTPGHVHHDLWVEGDNVWVLEREGTPGARLHESRSIVIDKITQLSLEDGHRIGEIDLLDARCGPGTAS